MRLGKRETLKAAECEEISATVGRKEKGPSKKSREYEGKDLLEKKGEGSGLTSFKGKRLGGIVTTTEKRPLVPCAGYLGKKHKRKEECWREKRRKEAGGGETSGGKARKGLGKGG